MQEEGPGVGIMGRALGCHAAAQTFSGRGVIISTCMSHDAIRCLSTTLKPLLAGGTFDWRQQGP